MHPPAQAYDRIGLGDGFWRRPEMYLDPAIRAARSTFAALPREAIEPGVARLHRDLDSGHWNRIYGELLSQESVDDGYRLIVAGENGTQA